MSFEENCCICFEQKTNIKSLQACHHSFCKDCIDTWNKEHVDCPLCRTISFPPQNIMTRKDKYSDENNTILQRFLILYLKKKIGTADRDFSYYKNLFEVFLLYPYFFFEEKEIRNLLECKVMDVRNEQMKNWIKKDKRQMNILLESISNLNKMYQR